MENLRKTLLVSDAFYLLAGGLLGPIYALFVEEIGGDLLTAGTTAAFFMLSAGVVVFLLSLWEDRSKHYKKFVIAGYGIGVLGYLGYPFVNSPLALFLVQIVLGFSVALKDPAYDALFSSSKKYLALAWGEWESVDYLTLGAGALMGGLIAQNLGFQVLLWLMFMLSIISFLVSLFLVRMREGDHDKAI